MLNGILLGIAAVGGLIAIAPSIAFILLIPKVTRVAFAQSSKILALSILSSYLVAPFFFWNEARQSADAQARQIVEQVKAIPVQPFHGQVPSAIAVQGDLVLRTEHFRKFRCPKPKTQGGGQITVLPTEKQIRLAAAEQRKREQREAAAPWPSRYLVLAADEKPPIATKARPAAGGDATWLYLHENGKDILIGVNFVPYISKPADFPLLTINGWYSPGNVMNADNDHLVDFLRSSLNVDCADVRVLPKRG